MPTHIEHIMKIPQTAIGKGTVGEPAPASKGKKGVTIRVAIFFDGTKNNRTNTTKRLDDARMHKLKGAGSSYDNYYSNPAIHEFMNNRRDPKKHEVSVYIEGIGTNDFSEEAKAAGKPDKENGNDDLWGNGFGAGPTGIREKVQKGLNQLRKKIARAYEPKKEYIEKIIFDTSGFSRGAAAARHFVARHKDLERPWPKQKSPKLVVNFVGLYDTVSSFALGIESYGALTKSMATKGLNTDKLFCEDVVELGLDLGAIPKQVVHLAAGDEHRQNFSLTTIATSLAAGVGVELTLPGVHSDVGGSYAEPDPANPTRDPTLPLRDLNKETRSVASRSEQKRLIEEGWYTQEQFRRGLTGLFGVRHLTNEYQYIPLRIMHHFALGQHGGGHEPMDLASFEDTRFTAYQVPAALKGLAQHLEEQAACLGRTPVARDDARYPHGTPPPAATCRTLEETKWLRNHYLHRSAQTLARDQGIGMAAREHRQRLIIPDDDPHFVPPSLADADPRPPAVPAW